MLVAFKTKSSPRAAFLSLISSLLARVRRRSPSSSSSEVDIFFFFFRMASKTKLSKEHWPKIILFFRWTKFVSWFLVFNWNRFSLKIRLNLLGRGTPTLSNSKLMSNKLNKNKVFRALSVIVLIIIIYYLIKVKIIKIFGRNCYKKITLNSLAQ